MKQPTDLHSALVLQVVGRFGTCCLNAEQVGEYLGCAPDCVERLHRESKRLMAFKIGKELRWSAESVVRFVRNGDGEAP